MTSIEHVPSCRECRRYKEGYLEGVGFAAMVPGERDFFSSCPRSMLCLHRLPQALPANQSAGARDTSMPTLLFRNTKPWKIR